MFIDYIATLILLMLAGFGFYLKERLKALAKVADVEAVTKAVESIRSEYASGLESIKAGHAREIEEIKMSLATQLHVSQTRYTHEYELLRKLTSKLNDLQLTARNVMFNPLEESGRIPDKDQEGELFLEALMRTEKFLQKNKPFFPLEVYGLCLKLGDLADKVAVLRYSEKDEGKAYRSTRSIVREIGELISDITQAIRIRIQSWESAT